MLPWMWNCIFSLFFMHLKFVRKFQYFWMDQVGFGFLWWCEAVIQIPVSGIVFWCKLVSFYSLCCLWNDNVSQTEAPELIDQVQWRSNTLIFVRLSSDFSIYNSLLQLGHLTSICSLFFLIEIIFSRLYSCLLLCLCLSSARTTQA
jgi:hypothetical protein